MQKPRAMSFVLWDYTKLAHLGGIINCDDAKNMTTQELWDFVMEKLIAEEATDGEAL